MEIGVFMQNHGLVRRFERGSEWLSVPVEDMRLLETAQLAEALGYATLWFPDHIFTIRDNDEGFGPGGLRKMRPDGCVMLETVTTMALVAGATHRITVAAGVLVAPYRHPLVVAQQLATIDAVSGGRTLVAVGAGWQRSEFDGLGVPFDERGTRTDETLRILDLAWREDWTSFEGRHYRFADVCVAPKPVQRPRIPLLVGGSTPAAARRAARLGDGFFPRLQQDANDPDFTQDALLDEIRREADRIGRDLTGFRLLALASARLLDQAAPETRPFLIGDEEQLLSDLAQLAGHGYSQCALRFDIESTAVEEFLDQVHRFGSDVLPRARRLTPACFA